MRRPLLAILTLGPSVRVSVAKAAAPALSGQVLHLRGDSPVWRRGASLRSGQGSVPSEGAASVANPTLVRGETRSRRRRRFRGRPVQFAGLLAEVERRGERGYVLPWSGEIPAAPVSGYSRRAGKWRRDDWEWPRVVYNRIPDRRIEQTAAFRQLLEHLHKQGCHVFNERFIDKGKLYQGLQQGELKSWVPETLPFSRENFTQMLRKYGELYLKPAQASAGAGVLRVRLEPGGLCRLRGNLLRADGAELKLAHKVKPRLLSTYVKNYSTGYYLCQQVVDLPAWGGARFDLRTLMQKDGRGEWRLTGWGVRLAGQGQVTTHVPRGGHIANAGVVLSNVFGRQEARRIMRRMHDALPGLARAVEQAVGMTMGELTIDLAVDRQGRGWILEANAKPMKFDEPGIRRRARRRLVDYCIYLAGK